MNDDRENYDVRHAEYRDDIEVDCQCGHRFSVARSLKGGLANCPACRRATQVPGGPEGLFWVLLLGGIAFALVLTAFFAVTLGPVAGVVTLAVSAAIILVSVLAS